MQKFDFLNGFQMLNGVISEGMQIKIIFISLLEIGFDSPKYFHAIVAWHMLFLFNLQEN